MVTDFILPDIGEGIVECELVKWLVQEGDFVQEDQPVAEVMTDKALVEIPAPNSGRVAKLYYREGDTAKVHSPLFAVDMTGAAKAANEESVPVAADKQADSKPAPESKPASASQPAGKNGDDFILPDIGEGIVECEIVEWRVAEGDHVEEDQPVVDVMTDKAVVEIPAPRAGRIVKLHYGKGDIAKVHTPLFSFAADGAAAVATPAKVNGDSAPKAACLASSAQKPVQVSGRVKVPASPAVRRLARELSLDLNRVPGSGKHGRVLKEDIHKYQKALQADAAPAQNKTPETPASVGEVRVEPIRGVRAVMAKRMVEAATTIPQFTFGDEVDVTALLALREQLKPEAEKAGVRLTLMPFIMKAMAMAVMQHPIMNSRVNDDCSEIHYLPHCNIGMAVDSKVGLLVPNVKHVERRSILDIAREVERLTNAARDGSVRQDDLKGGTISISNIGALGGTYASPIINMPEVAIVALGKTQTVPRFDSEGSVVARSIMNISWSGDHRIIDGGTIARFSNMWKSYLQDPTSMLLHLS
ncbi:dihydrolipoyllysine-residue acetyltransferase [Hahella sp. HN01]|uniref:dihydrolipoyllysine-residue acetyltransferase n=1 Tax=Hahella sp. HN01 TaxID=2847262 RepID=UPI001C1E9F0B|nr:dihydrolipoyllysine-residue acetyltransferase [Hahella sp. HN01]MBU6951220.1 dihydrolipoyllysine-residue acetyltransferase [Hahella sp. HN01]